MIVITLCRANKVANPALCYNVAIFIITCKQRSFCWPTSVLHRLHLITWELSNRILSKIFNHNPRHICMHIIQNFNLFVNFASVAI